MRAICLALLSASLVASPVRAQLADAPAALYAGADSVFDGRLEKLVPSPSGLTARFSVSHLIKGQSPRNKSLELQIPAVSRCHAFEENHRYLVYGRKVGDQLWVDPCEGSKLLSQAESDLRYIHTINPKISEQCNLGRLKQLARDTPVVATAKVVGTEHSVGPPTSLSLVRFWCGFAWSSEYAYYDVVDVLKGQIPDSKIAVEHAICWDTITVDGYNSTLSPELFRDGNVVLLFLKKGSNRRDEPQPPFKHGYEDVDENCGAVIADSDAARAVADTLRDPK